MNFSGKLYKIVSYGLDEKGFINYNDIETKIRCHHPKLVLAGASAYSREIDFKKIRSIIDKVSMDLNFKEEYKPYFMVDMAHIAGLVAAGDHQSPFGLADVISTTTHKTLRGTRGGLIFCKKDLAKKIDGAVFPGNQGGPLEHIIAAKAITAEEACTVKYKKYIHQVVKNSKAMCNRFIELGYKVVTGGTDNHMFLLDLSDLNVSGLEVQNMLDEYDITLNKNMIPNDKRTPKETSGVRIGTPAMTTKGYIEEDFVKVANKIDILIKQLCESKKAQEVKEDN